MQKAKMDYKTPFYGCCEMVSLIVGFDSLVSGNSMQPWLRRNNLPWYTVSSVQECSKHECDL